MGRSLTKEHHFNECIGDDVEVTFIRPNDLGKTFIGQLTQFTKDTITVVSDTNEATINLVDVANVKLYEEYDF